MDIHELVFCLPQIENTEHNNGNNKVKNVRRHGKTLGKVYFKQFTFWWYDLDVLSLS